jgi:hypothetical protein
VPANPHSASYLEVKRSKMRHDLASAPHAVSDSDLPPPESQDEERAPDSTRRQIAI